MYQLSFHVFICAFIRRSLHFSLLFLFLHYPYLGTFPFHVETTLWKSFPQRIWESNPGLYDS